MKGGVSHLRAGWAFSLLLWPRSLVSWPDLSLLLFS